MKGNILTKTDAGTYQYTNTSKPYAVTALAPASNSVPLRAQTVTYTSLQRPATITENGYTATFTYDDEGNRMKEVITNGGAAYLTKYYIGGIYEKETNTTNTIERLYLEGDYYSVPMVLVKTGTGAWTLRNILRDYQGSILKVTSATGLTTYGEYSYDAWGRMRDPSTWAVYAVGSEPSLFLGRGYTGHEHLPMFGLINMNARLYDPVLGRFLAPDPYVQASDFSQSYNRYGYCMNNPMKYVDEDGEFIHILIGAAVGAVGNLVVKGIQGKLNSVGDVFKAAGVGAIAGGAGAALGGVALVAAGGSLTTAGLGGFVAGAAGGMASAGTMSALQSAGNHFFFGDPFLSPKDFAVSVVTGAVMGGMINGTMAAASGRNFWTGDRIASGRGVFSFNNTPVKSSTEKLNPGITRTEIEDVVEKYSFHTFSGGRHNDLGLTEDYMKQKITDFVYERQNLLVNGDNTFKGNINGLNRSFKVFYENGRIRSINMYPNISNRITKGALYDFGKIKW